MQRLVRKGQKRMQITDVRVRKVAKEGKLKVVTGCSRGVGLEICRVLLEQGHTVYGVARSYTDE